MEKRVVLQVNGTKLHLVLGKTVKEWDETWGNEEDDCLWDIPFEELIHQSDRLVLVYRRTVLRNLRRRLGLIWYTQTTSAT